VLKLQYGEMNKLEAYSPLGYKLVRGEVVAMADDVKGFQIEISWPVGGNTAGHSEIVCVSSQIYV